MPVDAPLFEIPGPNGSCAKCRDLGLWLTMQGDVQPCPSIAAGDADHRHPSPAAKMIQRSIEVLRQEHVRIDSRTFEIARTLMQFQSEQPCSREDLLKTYFSYLPMTRANQLRKFHAVIEELRRVWVLPVGSRKESPGGYWIITDQKDFEEWFNRSKSAPLTQLTTTYRVAKRNFPIFAEQIELDFFNNVDPPPTAAAA